MSAAIASAGIEMADAAIEGGLHGGEEIGVFFAGAEA